MPLKMIETFEEFCERHGGEYVEVENWLVFPDGASCDDSFFVRRDPPSDPTELLWTKRDFVGTKLKRAERDFRSFKHDALEHAQHALRNPNIPPPVSEATQALQRLKGLVETHRAALAEINRQLNETPEAKREREREEFVRQRHQRIAALGRELQGIEI